MATTSRSASPEMRPPLAARLFAWLRHLEAFGPLRAAPTLDGPQERAAQLGAAAALQTRAESIQEWPIDEAATRFLTIIVTGVATGLVIQLILRALIQS